ncbi:MAG: hypothetical protein HEQ37_12435 [Acidovorax sp.]|nr:hypothetical protein [Acidovorax sp.]
MLKKNRPKNATIVAMLRGLFSSANSAVFSSSSSSAGEGASQHVAQR